MSNIAIEFENVGKMYRLGRVGTGTLSHDLNRWWQMSVLGKEDPFLKIGQTNDRTQKGTSDYVWALRDINFKVEQGEVLGIIGKNGAGKSTLLKLLSNITSPSTGKIKYRGRIASLLEVGTGFHPEMTGRENIYMNGAIMGMTKREITCKLDEIVDFAGVERYLDTPVKRYSSGMSVRLGFAVAAFLEPEILVVDEVLTVGDAEFQKRAIGKMQDVSRGEGRTVLFVSHNMAAVKMLCNTGIVLRNGMVDKQGSAIDCVNHYIGTAISQLNAHVVLSEKFREDNHRFLREVEFLEAWLLNEDVEGIATDEPLKFRIKMRRNDYRMSHFQFCLFFQNAEDVRVAFYFSKPLDVSAFGDTFYMDVTVDNHALPKGRYTVRMEANNQNLAEGSHPIDFVHHTISFEVKYIHMAEHDEYNYWQPEWGLRYHEDNGMNIQLQGVVNE